MDICRTPELNRLVVCGFDGIVFYNDIVTGVNEATSHHFIEAKVDIIPNPFNYSFKLEISGLPSYANRLIIRGSRQEIVKEINDVQNGMLEIEAQELTSGAYFYQIISNKKTVASGKLIKE